MCTHSHIYTIKGFFTNLSMQFKCGSSLTQLDNHIVFLNTHLESLLLYLTSYPN